MFRSIGSLLSRVTRMGRTNHGASKLTGKPRSQGYTSPTAQYQQRPRDLPPLGFDMIRAMLLDSAVKLGLAMRMAPICGLKIAFKDGDKWVEGVKAKRPEVGEFVRRQLQRIWTHGIEQIMAAQIWGWSAGEVTYRLTDHGTVEVDELLGRHSLDTRCLLVEGQAAGVRVLRVTNGVGHVDLPWPKAWFHAHRPEAGAHYGTTILLGAYSHWADKCFTGGATDVRRLFMHKDAYGGVDIAYPDDTLIINGQPVPSRDIALQIAEQLAAGGVTVRPKVMKDGEEQWTINRATIPNNPQHILQYPKDLDTEIYHGLEIPDDIIESESGGWAGKRIPLAAFYASLDLWALAILRDLTKQILEPLVLLNAGKAEEFEVTFQPLAEQAMEQQSQASPRQGMGAADFGTPQTDLPQSPPQSPGQERMSLVEAVGCGAMSAPGAIEVIRMRTADGNRWVTIGGRKDGAADHAGGFPVQLDKDGRIVSGGPKGLKGRHVTSVGEYFRKVRNTPDARKRRAEAKHDRQARAWGISPDEYREVADQVWKDRQSEHSAREAAKTEARRRLGITAGDIRRWENDGFDHASGKAKGLDTLGRELASQYPELGWGGGYSAESDDLGDYDAKLWDLLKEGKQSLPARDSDEFHQMVDEYMNYAYGKTSESSLEDDGVDWSKVAFSTDPDFERKHPRSEDGKFGDKQGGGSQADKANVSRPELVKKRWFPDESLQIGKVSQVIQIDGDQETRFEKKRVPSQEGIDYANRKIVEALQSEIDTSDPAEVEYSGDEPAVRKLAESILHDNPGLTPPEFLREIKSQAKQHKLRNWDQESALEEVYSWKEYMLEDATHEGPGADLEQALRDVVGTHVYVETQDGDPVDADELLEQLKIGRSITAKQLLDRAANAVAKNRWRIVDGNGYRADQELWPSVFEKMGFDGVRHGGQEWRWKSSEKASSKKSSIE